jgi:hypothetical protein
VPSAVTETFRDENLVVIDDQSVAANSGWYKIDITILNFNMIHPFRFCLY